MASMFWMLDDTIHTINFEKTSRMHSIGFCARLCYDSRRQTRRTLAPSHPEVKRLFSDDSGVKHLCVAFCLVTQSTGKYIKAHKEFV